MIIIVYVEEGELANFRSATLTVTELHLSQS